MANTPADSSRRSRIEQRFGAAAEAYASSEGHRGGPDLDLLLELAATTGAELALDVATGAGNTALALGSRVRWVVAADLSVGMVSTTRRRFAQEGIRGSVTSADAEALPFRDACFDLAVCRIAPHHFLDVVAAFREVGRVLVTGGRFVLVDSASPEDDESEAFLHRAEVLRDPTHVRAHRPAGWAALVAEGGFRVDRVEVVRKRHLFEPWLERGGVDPQRAEDLRRRFLAAGKRVSATLDLERSRDRIEAFTDDKVVIAARRP